MKHTTSQFGLVGLRLVLGWIFLWAFVDKTFGLGFATKPEAAWLAGGSPTTGFLKFATTGPLALMYQSLAGNAVIDVLFMLALLGIGVSMILGIGMKLGSYVGALVTFLMWTALLFPANNPILDEHIVYVVAFLLLSSGEAGKWFGLGNWWAKTKLVKQYSILK